jgi:hypothetical protein
MFIVNIICIDDLQQTFVHETQLLVGPAQACTTCSTPDNQTQTPAGEANNAAIKNAAIGLAMLVFTALVTVLLVRRNGRPNTDSAWGEGEDASLSSLEDLFEGLHDETVFDEVADSSSVPEFVPEGWTVEDFSRWLDGPVPEGWTDEQWGAYVDEHRKLLAQIGEVQQG